MKINVLFILITSLLIFNCSNIQKIDITHSNVFLLDDLIKIEEEKFMELLKSGKGIVVSIPNGKSLPVKFNVRTNFVKLEKGKDKIIFLKDTYVFISENRILLSNDKKNWAYIQDIKGLKEIFGNTRGLVEIGLTYKKDDGVLVTFGAVME